ncbi:MAG TPA: radical SAM protein [Thermoanaerobaculia bacterium]|jgi:MoaA/NifB/PqqE/SkfB family radical SAM enzyme|nr:radical SAM protein [Thermoanaerobaculia bacterium]
MTTAPLVPLLALDTLWFQVAGTLCNIECTHCFISSSPTNRSHAMLTLADCERRLAEARELGVREYYFTGGEPFMNRDMLAILEATLRQGPATVLTNGMLLRPETCQRLRELFDGSEYALDLRVSLDGFDRHSHDAIRGAGVWDKVMAGLGNLAAVGLNPVITVTTAASGVETSEGRARFLELIRGFGFQKPRLKVLSLFRIGAEETRTRAYEDWERLSQEMLEQGEVGSLQCASGRMVTSQGVFVCPILIEEPGARMGDTLAVTLRPFALRYGACHTCWVDGVTCTT